MAPSDAQQQYDQLPEEHKSKFGFDNEGNLVFKNRVYRRGKPPTNNWYTKKTHAIQKKREKINAKSKHNR
jgi:hypothetical protein